LLNNLNEVSIKYYRMKKVTAIIFFGISTLNAIYSQEDSIHIKHAFSVSINDLFIKRILVTYTRSFNQYSYFETSLGYRYSGPVKHDEYGGDSFIDLTEQSSYLLYYNIITTRIGIKFYNTTNFLKHLFYGFDVNYNYKFNNQIDDIHHQSGDYKSSVQSIKKNEIGGIVKVGFLFFLFDRFVVEYYGGLGIQRVNYSEVDYYKNDRYEPDGKFYQQLKDTYFLPSIHIGLSIGFRY
jgi:hypothetical protein